MVVTADEATAESEAKNTDNPASGAGGVENFIGTAKALSNGDWDTAGLSTVGLGLDAVGLAADPLGTLASWGIGWVIENVSFIREPFDALMGNPDAIGGMSSTWENIGKELKAAGKDYAQAVQGTTDWEGKAGDAYRNLGADVAKTLDGIGEACNGMKGAVDGAGTVVGAVRGIVRDLIAGAVGEIIGAVAKWLAASVATAGIAIGGAIADAVRIALKWAEKISGWMNKLADVLKSLSSYLDKFGSAGQSLRTKVDDYFAGLANAPSGNLVNVQSKPFSAQSIEDLGQTAATRAAEDGTSKLGQGLLAGGAEYKPFTKGDIWQPNLDMGPDGGRAKMSYEVVKGAAALDDGRDPAGQNQDDEK
jgi:hypothetical protein